MPPIDDWIRPVTLGSFTGQVFEEGVESDETTVDCHRDQPCGDLVVDKSVDVLCCYAFGRFVTDGGNENVQVTDVVLQSAGSAKATSEVLLKTNTCSVHVGLR